MNNFKSLQETQYDEKTHYFSSMVNILSVASVSDKCLKMSELLFKTK